MDTSRVYATSMLIPYYTIQDQGLSAVRVTKRELADDLRNRVAEDGGLPDGSPGFRTYAQRGFNPRDLLYKEAPWIPGTRLPEWATLIRVEAEVFAK